MSATVAVAAVPVHIVKTDLKPLIRAGFDSPVQFAVLVPHAVSAASGGSWSVAAGRATWQYAVDVPTAVSLSFHATLSSLPASAVLVVRGTQSTVSYRAHDLHRGELWSRIQPGAALQFALNVAAEDRGKVAFNIVSLQAGYRSLGPGVSDHPYYRELKAQQAAATSSASCVTNYACQVSPGNTPSGAATVALVVGNLNQCSGSLINDVPGDNTPYILTARHCETGHLGGGLPGAASGVTVYWDATSPCGKTLASIYDAGVPAQTGARTIVEQQDAWLIELDAQPVVADAQLAGFDASGGPVQGGYTIHHAQGYDKQFTGWFGQAMALQQSAVLGVKYVSDFWETVNATGNVGPGASGSGLFDQNNHLVGALTLGRATSDASGYGSCPIANPPAPNGANGVADFTALASVWNSTADSTSTTGSATLKSVLDPNNSGITVVPSAPLAVIIFGAAEDTVIFGQPVRLMWSAANATQCSAGEGVAGDGWTGTLPPSGTQLVSEPGVGVVSYSLTCAYPGGRSSVASTRITWASPAPQLQFTASTASAWAGTGVSLSWSSNVAPCSISGGGVALSNLSASGTTPITGTAAGEVLYTLSCGPANDGGRVTTPVQWLDPSLAFYANGTDRLLGAAFSLQWVTAPNTQCTPSGGAPNDGWASTAFPPGSAPQFDPQVTTLGTYTYSLTCSAGALSLQKSVTVTFEDSAPYATATLGNPTVTFSDSPADYVTLTYNSNLSSCSLSSTSNINTSSAAVGTAPQGVLTLAPPASGTYQVSLTCTAFIAGASVTVNTTPTTLTVLPPPAPTATIAFNPGAPVVGQPFTISWSSINAESCTATGGIPGGAWAQSADVSGPPAGSVADIAQSGQFTYGLTCQSVDPSVGSVTTQATLNIAAHNVSHVAGPAPDAGHGGGGAIGVLELTLLAVLGAWRRPRVARAMPSSLRTRYRQGVPQDSAEPRSEVSFS